MQVFHFQEVSNKGHHLQNDYKVNWDLMVQWKTPQTANMRIHINELKWYSYVHIRSIFIERYFVSLKIFRGLITAEKSLNSCSVPGGNKTFWITGKRSTCNWKPLCSSLQFTHSPVLPERKAVLKQNQARHTAQPTANSQHSNLR